MQFILHFPLVDLRQLSGGAETVDVWPSSDMSRETIEERMSRKPFIRNFGKIEGAQKGNFYCNINCVAYDPNESQVSEEDFLWELENKRLYNESLFTKTAEFEFLTYYETSTYADLNSPHNVQISHVLTRLMTAQIELLNINKKVQTKEGNRYQWITADLGSIASAMAVNYGVATRKSQEQEYDPASVVSGEPCILLAYESGANVLRPANCERLDEFAIDSGTVSLFGYKWNFNEQTYKVYLFELPFKHISQSLTGYEALRARQANLLRLNAEKETIKILVNHVRPEHTRPEIRKYLKKTPEKVFRKERFSTGQHTVRGFALQSDTNSVKFATLDDLEKLFDKYNMANIRKIEEGMKAEPAKKSILFITSNPTDSNPIDFGEQFKILSEALKSGSDRDYFVLLNIETGVERENLIDILYTKQPDFLHITLHASEINGLYFQGVMKKPDPMTAQEFADCLKCLNELQKVPEAVILCACNSLTHAEAVKAYCRFAVGTNYVFPEDAAVVYAKNFYNALFNGMAVEFCHRRAIHGIQYHKPSFDPIDNNEVYTIPQLIVSTR